MNDLMIKTGFDLDLKPIQNLEKQLKESLKFASNISIKVDTKQALNEINKFDRTAKETLKPKEVKVKVPDIDANLDSISKKINDINFNDKLFKDFQKIYKETGNISNAFKDVTKNLTDNEISSFASHVDKNYNKLSKSIDEATENTEELKKEINETVESTKSFGNIVVADIIGEQLSNIGGIFTQAGQSALEYENTLGRLEVSARGNIEVFNELKTSAENIFVEGFGDSFNDVTNALTLTQKSLGNIFDTKEIEEFTRGALQLSKVFDEDINNVVQRSRTFITEFGLNSKEALDLLALGFRDAANADDDIIDTFNEFSGIAREAGFTAERFTQTLINGVQAGARNTVLLSDSILEAGIRLNDLSASKTISEIGGETSQVVTDILRLGESGAITVEETLRRANTAINEAFDAGKIGNSIRQQMQVAISGTPAEDLGADLYSRIFTADIDENAVRKTASEASRIIDESFQRDAFAPISRTFELLFNNIAASATPLLNITGNVLSTVGQFAPAIQLFQQNIDIFKDVATTLLKTLVPAYATTATSATAAGTASTVAGNATKIAWLSALAPIGLIVAGVGAVAGAFILAYKNIEPFRETIDGLVENVKSFTKTIIEQAKPTMEQLGYIFVEIGTFIKDIFIAQFEILGSVIKGIINIWTSLFDTLGIFKKEGRESVSVLDLTKSGFQTLTSTIEIARKSLAGISNAFKFIVERIKDFISAMTSFNINDVINAFSGFGEGVGQAYVDGFNNKSKEIELTRVQKQYFNNLKNDIETAFEGVEAPEDILGVAKSIEERIEAEKAANNISIEQAEKLSDTITEIKKTAYKEQNRLSLENEKDINARAEQLNKESLEKREKAYKEYINTLRDLQNDISGILTEIEQTITDNQISSLEENRDNILENIKINESERLKQALEIDNEIYKLRLENEIKNIQETTNEKLSKLDEERQKILNNEDLTNKEREKLLSELGDKRSAIELQTLINIETIKDNYKNKQIQNEINRQKEINEAIQEENIQNEIQRIELIRDSNLREKELKLFNLEQTFKEELELAKGNYNKELELYIQFNKDKERINKDYILKEQSQTVKIVSQIGNSLSQALSNDDIFSIVSENRNKEALKSIENEQKLLEDALDNQLLSYSDYQEKLLDLNKQRIDAENEQNKSVLINFDIIAQTLSNTFKEISENSLSSLELNNERIQTLRSTIVDIDNELLNVNKENVEEYNKLLNKRNDLEEQANEISKENYDLLGTVIGSTFAQALADGQSFTKGLVLATLQGLKASVQLIAVEILGKELAKKSFAGIPAAAILQGLLFGALSVAESAVNKLQFEKGGLNPHGFSQEGLVSKHIIEYAEGNNPEFIFNAKTTQKNLKAFDEINRRNITIEQYYKENNNDIELLKTMKNVEKLLQSGVQYNTYRNYNIKAENKEIKQVARTALNYR